MKRRYEFEIGDLRAFVTVVNVMLIIRYGLTVAWFGLAVSLLGVVMDITKYYHRDRSFRINSVVCHIATVVLNIYFMCV